MMGLVNSSDTSTSCNNNDGSLPSNAEERAEASGTAVMNDGPVTSVGANSNGEEQQHAYIGGSYLMNESLARDMLSEILMRVDSRTLVKSVTRVCRLWTEILADNKFWIQKCLLDNVTLPPKHIRTVYPFNFKIVCLRNPYGRNLIKNPSGDEGIKHWKILSNKGNGFQIERPPIGSDTEDVPVCFATSYGKCIKQQKVNLEGEGIEGWVLDELKPKITICEWHAARFDCGAKYDLHVKLVGGCLSDGRNQLLAEHRSTVVTRQWEGREWSKVSHEFTEYPAHIRYVDFTSCGVDTQYWAGHYGPKMCKAAVTVSFDGP